MKTIKIISIVTVLVILGVVSVGAIAGNEKQAPASVGTGLFEMLPTVIMGHLTEQLKLTEEQQAKILPILENAAQQRQAKMAETQGQFQERMQAAQAEHQAAWQDVEQQLAAILTPEQMQTLTKMREDFQGKAQTMRQRFADRQGARGEFGQIMQELNLTAAQKQQMFAIFMKNRDNRQDMFNNMQETRTQVATLMQEMLNSEFDEQKVRELYRETTAKMEDRVVAGAKMLAELKAVLTPEQVQLLQEKVPELLNRMPGNMPQRHAFLSRFGK